MDDTSAILSDSVSSMSDVPMSIVKLVLTPILSFSSLFSTEFLQGYNLIKAASVFDGFRMTQRIMLFPSEKFDAYLDMLITSINSLLDYIEMRFGYLMLKHIEADEQENHSPIMKLGQRIKDMLYRLYYGLWNHMINVEVTLISSSSNMILNISTYPLQTAKYVVDKIVWNDRSNAKDNGTEDATQIAPMRRVDKSKGELSRKKDRAKRISVINEEEVEQEEDNDGTVETIALSEILPEPSVKSSTESLVECLESVSKILSEVSNLDENDKMFKYVVQEEIQYLVEQTKAENNQYEKIQHEIAAIEKDIENIEHDDNERKVDNGLKNGLIQDDKSTNDISQPSEVSIIAQAPFKKEYKALSNEASVDKDAQWINGFLDQSPTSSNNEILQNGNGVSEKSKTSNDKDAKEKEKPYPELLSPKSEKKKKSFWKRRGSWKTEKEKEKLKI